jgi:[ribosomal protein S18]-alanine N-acetyltransferase
MIVIVTGGRDNIDAVMQIMTSAFDPAFGEAWTRNQILGSLAMTQTQLLLAKSEAEIIGFALIRTICDETELLMIGVDKNWQRQKIASQLLFYILDQETALGRKSLFLEVRSNNHARQFYEKSGFKEIGKRVNYYKGENNIHHDAVTMSHGLLQINCIKNEFNKVKEI